MCLLLRSLLEYLANMHIGVRWRLLFRPQLKCVTHFAQQLLMLDVH